MNLCPLATRPGPSLLFTRSFHGSARSSESSLKRAARLKKAKNLAKRAEINAEASATRPHPVLGLKEGDLAKWNQTKLCRTLVTLSPPQTSFTSSKSTSSGERMPEITPPPQLNFGFQAKTAHHLLNTVPQLHLEHEMKVDPVTKRSIMENLTITRQSNRNPYNYQPQDSSVDPSTAAKVKAAVAQAENMARIIDLRNANNQGIQYENRRRIVQTFGDPETVEVRGGPDTGRPEVQAALLTSKIRNLWSHLSRPGNSRDIHGRRAVTLLVHQRAKILKYLKRTDVVRYEVLLPQLGLEKGAVEGEIVVR